MLLCLHNYLDAAIFDQSKGRRPWGSACKNLKLLYHMLIRNWSHESHTYSKKLVSSNAEKEVKGKQNKKFIELLPAHIVNEIDKADADDTVTTARTASNFASDIEEDVVEMPLVSTKITVLRANIKVEYHV